MSQVIIPFNAAARRHTEGPFFDESFTPGTSIANVVQGSTGEVPSYPFLRNVLIHLTCSGGSAGSGTLEPDAPWNAIAGLQLSDANGSPIYGGIGTWDGYDTFLSNLFGGYTPGCPHPGELSGVDTTSVVGFELWYRIPLEFDLRTGAGSLGNMAANAPFRVQIQGNTADAIWDTQPSVVPELRLRGYIETWTLPKAANLAGHAQEQLPPGGLGTTQYWRKASPTVTASSQNRVKFTDLGYMIRNWILVVRDTNGDRLTDAIFPDPFTLSWDSNPLLIESPDLRKMIMSTALPLRVQTALPAGVLAFMFDTPDGFANGGDGPNSWIPTLQSTRMEFDGVFGAGVTSMDILTNAVAAVETAQPYSYGSETGQLTGPAQPSTRG